MSVYDLDVPVFHPAAGNLRDHAGAVALLVNVASECGYTPQYAGLQALHDELAPRGFTVLGFPSDEFGGQEPGDHATIAEFCRANFGVTFPLLAKGETKPGPGRSPLWAAVEAATGWAPTWNFCKALVDRDGHVRGFYESGVAPDDAGLRADVERLLG